MPQLRQAAALSGARDISAIEIDVGLTDSPVFFSSFTKGLTDHLAFKGGTFLRKTRGRSAINDTQRLLYCDDLAAPTHSQSVTKLRRDVRA